MTNDTDTCNNDERIVAIREIVDGEETVFFAIRDVRFDYWRTSRPLHHSRAWTKNRRRRAEFPDRGSALDELLKIRRERATADVRELDLAVSRTSTP